MIICALTLVITVLVSGIYSRRLVDRCCTWIQASRVEKSTETIELRRSLLSGYGAKSAIQQRSFQTEELNSFPPPYAYPAPVEAKTLDVDSTLHMQVESQKSQLGQQ